MARKKIVGMLAVVGAVVMAGCTSVQKGTMAGGALGSGVGATAGHAVSSVGSGPGAIIGFALGAAGGAIAAEQFYPSDDSEDLAAANQTIEQLSAQVESKDRVLAQSNAALEREKSQQKALLEVYEKARQQPATLSASAGAEQPSSLPEGVAVITIKSEVLFPSGKASLTTEGKAALKKAAQQIQHDYPNAEIEVRGHTDNAPIRYSPYKSNYELSCARATAVASYLIESGGFSASQVRTVGQGESQPVASNATAAGRAKNRRAEIVVSRHGAQVADVRAAN